MDVLAEVRKIKDAGIKEKDIAEALGFKSTAEFRRWSATTKLVEHKIKKANMTEQKKPWTGKVVCVKDSIYFKKGVIYECNNGRLIDDTGTPFNDTSWQTPYYSFDDIVFKMRLGTTADFIEYVE